VEKRKRHVAAFTSATWQALGGLPGRLGEAATPEWGSLKGGRKGTPECHTRARKAQPTRTLGRAPHDRLAKGTPQGP